MNTPGLLIEYLIIGGITSVWLVPLLSWTGIINVSVIPKEAQALLAIPLLYVTGLTIEMVGGYILRKPKENIRQKLRKEHESQYGEVEKNELLPIIVLHSSPELGKGIAMRSSRARIARGTLVNLILLSLSVLVLFVIRDFSYRNFSFLLFLVGICCLFCYIWKKCEERSFQYRLLSLSTLKDGMKTKNL